MNTGHNYCELKIFEGIENFLAFEKEEAEQKAQEEVYQKINEELIGIPWYEEYEDYDGHTIIEYSYDEDRVNPIGDIKKISSKYPDLIFVVEEECGNWFDRSSYYRYVICKGKAQYLPGKITFQKANLNLFN